MTVNNFISHLYKKIWIYIMHEKSYREYSKIDENNDYDPSDFYSDNIPELISNLKSDFPFHEAFNEVVGSIDISIRPIITNFMAWYSAMENKSGSDIYNMMYRYGLNVQPLNDLIKIVEVTNLPEISESQVKDNKLDIVFTVIEKFTTATKSLINRRKGKPIIDISDEYDVQDIIHVMLKPFIPAIKNEEVVPGNDVNHFLKIDFLLQSEKAALECKYIRNLNHAKNISKELNDDIQSYMHHQDCNNIVFFIYDKNLIIENPDALEDKYTNKQSVNGKDIQIYLKIRPKN